MFAVPKAHLAFDENGVPQKTEEVRIFLCDISFGFYRTLCSQILAVCTIDFHVFFHHIKMKNTWVACPVKLTTGVETRIIFW